MPRAVGSSQRGQFVVTEDEGQGRDGVVQVMLLGCADDRSHDRRLLSHPCQRELRSRDTALICDRRDRVTRTPERKGASTIGFLGSGDTSPRRTRPSRFARLSHPMGDQQKQSTLDPSSRAIGRFRARSVARVTARASMASARLGAR